MVTVLKEPVEDSKGVVVFTHKERQFFDSSHPLVSERFDLLREEYVVGMHWGGYSPEATSVPFVDFHLANRETVQFEDESSVRRIELVANNFTPDYFRSFDVPAQWDVLCVGHPIKTKRFNDVLRVLRAAYDEGTELSALFICPVPDRPSLLDGERWDMDFFELYESAFSDAERERIELVTPIEDAGLYPLPNDLFPYIYNASNVFVLFSRDEGDPRVVHEALLCGTPVLVREDLRGSGKKYLDERNSRIVSDLHEAREAIVAMATESETFAFDPAYLYPELRRDHTADRLEAEIQDVFRELGEPYTGEMVKDDLAMRLPSHTTNLPPDLRKVRTDDLRSVKATVMYVDRLLGRSTPVKERWRLELDARSNRSKRTFRRVGHRTIAHFDDVLPFPVTESVKSIHERFLG